MQWLDRVELQLFSSKTIWGPPEVTKDKLATLLVSSFPGACCVPGTRPPSWMADSGEG